MDTNAWEAQAGFRTRAFAGSVDPKVAAVVPIAIHRYGVRRRAAALQNHEPYVSTLRSDEVRPACGEFRCENRFYLSEILSASQFSV
jgi:hypothetical protein